MRTEYRFKSTNRASNELRVVTDVGVGQAAKFEVGAPSGARYEYLFVSRDDTIELALNLLRDAGREDLLAEPPYIPLAERVGQFVRHVHGREGIVKIVGPGTLGFSPDKASAVTESGSSRQIYNEPDVEHWVPVEVNVIPAQPEKWEVAE